MKYGSVAIAYREERLIPKHLEHIPEWVEKTVVVSNTPWEGEDLGPDKTFKLASELAQTYKGDWKSEEAQRTFSLSLHQDKDWVIILDPDEFLSNEDWENLKNFLENTDADAVVAEKQRVFWKKKEVSPHTDYQQLIAVRPWVRFIDKRVVDTSYVVAPVTVLHFSWARTDEEVWDKITHYAHANDFDTKKWFYDVWLANKTENLHPVSPETLKALIEPKLPKEIERLKPWQGL